MNKVVIFLAAAALFSCEKAELPKPLSGAPSANTISVSMGSDYANQLFFDLESAAIVSQNNRESWDLAFDCSENGRMITLNGSKFMAVSITNESDLADVNASTPVNWTYDNQKGMQDSLALRDWELNQVYIVDRGTSITGAPLGKVKFRITASTLTSYTIQWSELSASVFYTNEIVKNSAYNFRFFAFQGQGQMVSVEPEKALWDLCFTTYTYIYPDGVPYLVNGVLSNRNLVMVKEVDVPYESVSYAYAVSAALSHDLDIIGYDWKFYDFDTAGYTILFDKIYLVKSVEGRYFKLRFLDFYDPNGSKGTPSFELQEIVP